MNTIYDVAIRICTNCSDSVLFAGAKFRTSGEKSANVQSNEFASTSSSENTNNTTQNDNNIKQANNETLDLADLDLSQLRLTKKDLETLSSITPSLPKHFQDQLLAQLPPNQARKLSRTLSMQATGRAPCVYKRSLSSGREALETVDASSTLTSTPKASNVSADDNLVDEQPSLLSFDRNSVLRRSMNRGRDQALHRRSTSAIRSEFPSRLSYTGDLRSDFTVTKPSDSLANRYRLTDYTSAISPSSALRPDYYSKLPLPTSSMSPQKSPSNETLESPIRRRSSQRGLSRFSRPDFYGSASSINVTEDNELQKVRREKERETQSVLREIRERSRDRLRSSKNDAQDREVEPNAVDTSTHKDRRKSSIPNIRITVDKQNGRIYHARNKSMERCCDVDESPKIDENDAVEVRKASMTNARTTDRPTITVNDERSQKQSAAEFTDEILGELLRRSKQFGENDELPQNEAKKAESEIAKKPKLKSKDGKKLKTKQKSVDSIDKPDNEITNDSKITTEPTTDVQSVTLPLPKSSKIARRMSYPSKEENNENDKTHADKKVEVETPEMNGSVIKPKSNEVKLPTDTKSYPNSKLTPPKEVNLKTKKSSTSNAACGSNTRNAITAVMEKLIEKSAERLSPGKSMTSMKAKNDAGETSPPKTKKKIKVVKKLIQSDQSPAKEPSPKSNETSNETSPVKERKSPEKKLKSGFLYTIGQKFEKMREKNKEKEKKLAKSTEMPVAATNELNVKVQIGADKEPRDVETVQTIIIPRRVKDSQGESVQNEEITIRQIEPPLINANVNPIVIPVVNPSAKAEQRKSRIDAVIRNLRERSVPHTIRTETRESELTTESGLLKRAISVEDMTNGASNFNKGNVNKVLGLFRRIEKEQQLQKQHSFPATSLSSDPISKERPKSGGFVGKAKKGNRPYYTGAKSDTIITLTDQFERQYLSERANQSLASAAANTLNTKIPYLKSSSSSTKPESQSNSFDFVVNGSKECSLANAANEEKARSMDGKRASTSYEVAKPQIPLVNSDSVNTAISEKERIRNNRKGLVLDLSNEQFNDQFKKISNDCSNNNNSYHLNINGKSHAAQCNGSSDNHVNNNFTGNGNYYPYYGHGHSHAHRHSEQTSTDALTPSCEVATNYSSDNRSNRDDCESTSTFLSPTDEPDLCFDDWSGCSGKCQH